MRSRVRPGARRCARHRVRGRGWCADRALPRCRVRHVPDRSTVAGSWLRRYVLGGVDVVRFVAPGRNADEFEWVEELVHGRVRPRVAGADPVEKPRGAYGG